MLLGYRQADGLGGGILDSPTRSDFLGLMLQQVYIPGPSGPRPTLSLVHKLKDVAAVRYFLVNPDGKFPADEVGLRPVPNDTGFQVLENPSCLPAAFFVRSVREVGPGSGDALQVLGFNGRQPITQPLDEALSAIAGDDFDPNETAAVLGKTSPDVLSSKARSARVLETKTVPGRWEIATDADAPGQLVISEGYDPGWRCEIDEKPAAVYQTDDQIMSVSVPAGKHAVLLKYDPPEFRRGAWVTVVGIVLLLACAAAGFVVGARKRAPASQFS
jgi:hypothetical protein